MLISRRTFSRGLGSLTAVRALPGRFGSIAGRGTALASPSRGFDDAYERLLCEYIRVEEEALYIGASRTGGAPRTGGAATWQGRQLESFIAELDRRVDVTASARQIYDELRDRLRRALRDAPERIAREPRRATGATDVIEDVDDVRDGDDMPPASPESADHAGDAPVGDHDAGGRAGGATA